MDNAQLIFRMEEKRRSELFYFILICRFLLKNLPYKHKKFI